MNTDLYTYRVTWSPEDQEHVGLCAEFPSLSWLDKDVEKAFCGIRQLVKATVEDMIAEGEEVPEAIAAKEYSGKFAVRVPPSVHRKLALDAAEHGISMNRLISSKLA